MSEMLANHYFHVARFGDAARGFEAVLRKFPDHLEARKRLAVCYVHLSRLNEAVELAVGVMREEFRVSVKRSSLSDSLLGEEGLPVKTTVEEFRNRENSMTPVAFQTGLGVLELFRDEQAAFNAFALASGMGGAFGEVKTLQSLVRRHLEEHDA